MSTRWSFLVDEEGVIQFVQNSGLNEPRDLPAMIEAAESLAADQGAD